MPAEGGRDALRDALQAALGDAYALERELGRGGMATVYLARDRKHERLVALKALHSDLGAALGAERFQREIKVAARLQHPHILTVYDSGEAAGRLWFTMPYVEGESLRERLRRERRLPAREALRIATEAARALDYAHRHGIVHRDVKPENILITKDGDTLVADFGIARALGDGTGEGAAGAERLTGTGLAVGTPAYMSPEQRAGGIGLDARTDVYSLGAVLYELLTGERPVTGPALSGRPAGRALPEAVEPVLARALATAPADRYATAAELAAALEAAAATISASGMTAVPGLIRVPARRRAIAAGAAAFGLLALAGGGAWLLRGRGVASGARSEVPNAAPEARVAVLPFENLGDSADAYFADGMADAVRGKLTALPGVAVIARASSMQYRGTEKPPRQVAEELGVRYLLTGTVRWVRAPGGASRVQVSPELVEVVAEGAPRNRWQQPFEADLADVFRVQADIAGRVADAMRVALGGADRARLARAPTANPAAYDAYLHGEAEWDGGAKTDPPSLRRAIGHFERAVALDSAMAEGWEKLSRTVSILYRVSTPTPALARQARDAADRAAALDPAGAPGRRALAVYHRNVEIDNVRALAELEAAQRAAPGDAGVLTVMANAKQALGRFEDAVRDRREALALDPRSPLLAGGLARGLIWLRRYSEAREPADRARALAPTSLSYIQSRAMTELGEGDLAGARQVLAAATRDVQPAQIAANMATYYDLGWALDDAGQRLVLTLGPEAFDGDRAQWGIVRAQLFLLRGDTARSRIWADTARAHFAAQLRAVPDDAQLHSLYGLALAYLGRRGEAVAEGARGVAMGPRTQDAVRAPYLESLLAQIYLLTGQPDKALDQLERVLRVPFYISPAWLRIDPTFASLRGNPRFERLASGR